MDNSNPDHPDPDNNFRPPQSPHSPVGHRSASVEDSRSRRSTSESKRKSRKRSHDHVHKRPRIYSPCIEDWQAAASMYHNTLPTYQKPSTSYSSSVTKYPSPTSTYPNPETTYPNVEYSLHSASTSVEVAGPSYMTAGSATPAFESIEPAASPVVSSSTPVDTGPTQEFHGTKNARFKSRWLRCRPAETLTLEEQPSNAFQPIASTSQEPTATQNVNSVSISTQVDTDELSAFEEEQREGSGCIMCQATNFCRRHCMRFGIESHKPCCLHGMELGSSTGSPATERTQTPGLTVDAYRNYHHDRFLDPDAYIPVAQNYVVTTETTDVSHYSATHHDSAVLYENVPE